MVVLVLVLVRLVWVVVLLVVVALVVVVVKLGRNYVKAGECLSIDKSISKDLHLILLLKHSTKPLPAKYF